MLLGKFIKAGVAALLVSFGVSSASAAVLYDSQGFETPPFINGANLVGQDPVNGPWVTDNNTSQAIVQNITVASGAQAVRVDRGTSGNPDQRWWINQAITPSERYVIVEWDQRTNLTSLPGVTWAPLFGVEAYDAVGTTFPLAGASWVDSGTGEVLYQETGTGFLAPTGTVVSLGQWHHFGLQLDYNTGSYQIFVNGTPVVSEAFVDGPIVGFSDAPIGTVRGSNDPADVTAPGVAFFDNYIIYTSNTAIPEPASLGLLALVSVALIRRSRSA